MIDYIDKIENNAIKRLFPMISQHIAEISKNNGELPAKPKEKSQAGVTVLVECWTPCGNSVTVQVNLQQAEWVRRMNPNPINTATTNGKPHCNIGNFRCIDCQHSLEAGYPGLNACAKGQQALGCSGYWWSLDHHFCSQFKVKD